MDGEAELCDFFTPKLKKMKSILINLKRFEKPDESGWEFDYNLLSKLSDFANDRGENICLQEVQAILIALFEIS